FLLATVTCIPLPTSPHTASPGRDRRSPSLAPFFLLLGGLCHDRTDEAGALVPNHNEARVRAPGLKVLKGQSSVKAGINWGTIVPNHNEARVRAPSLKVQSSVKAGINWGTIGR